mgnify:CR=1 FL=1
MNKDITLGMDLGDKNNVVVVLDDSGNENRGKNYPEY